MEPERPSRNRSPWVWIGCTCGGLVVLVLAVLAVGTWLTFREAKSVKESWKSPELRAQKTREVLPYKDLPPGYYPLGSFSIPLVMRMAFFGDTPPVAGEQPNRGMKEHGFIYMSMLQMRGNRREMMRYIKGEAPEQRPGWMRGNVNFETGDLIRRGTVQVGGKTVYYVAQRGQVHQPGRSVGGLLTLVLPDCADDSRVRFGMWLGPDPAPGTPIAELDVRGTNADPQALTEFLSHFELCPGK